MYYIKQFVNYIIDIMFNIYLKNEAITMYLSEVQTHLQNLINLNISQTEIAKALGVGRANISLRMKNNSIVTQAEINKIEKYFKVNLTNNKQTTNKVKNVFTAKLFTDVIGSCGNGVFEQSQNYEMITLPKNFVKDYSSQKSYSIITAYGDSMEPSIQDKDKLIIEHVDSNVIIDNRIYVFVYDEQIYVKRLVKNIDEIVIISDNPDKTIYKPKTINSNNIDSFTIIGQVVGLFRNLNEV